MATRPDRVHGLDFDLLPRRNRTEDVTQNQDSPPLNGTAPQDPGLRPPGPLRSGAMFRMAILGLLLAISAIVVIYLLTEVRGKLAELSSSPQDNVQWTLAQTEVEFLEFVLAVNRVPQDGTPPADALRQLRLRYDILYSRMRTIQDGDAYHEGFADPALSRRLSGLSAEIYALADRIDQPNDRLLADLSALRSDLTRLRAQVRILMTEGNRALSVASDQARRGVSLVLTRLVIASMVLLVTVATMAILFRRTARQSEARLRQNLVTSGRMEAIFSTSRDGIAVINAAGRIIALNRAGYEMFGRTEADTSGKSIATLLARRTEKGLEAVTGRYLFDTVAAGRKTAIRKVGLRPDGTEFPVELSLNISTHERAPICVCVIRDNVHQATVEAELKDSRDRARAGERAKARFLGVISHEMRTPLNGILGTISLIGEDLDTRENPVKELRETYLPVLRNSARILLSLVNDVLDITQIESGIRLSARPFDLDALLSDLVAAEQGQARINGNTLQLSTLTPIGRVQGDPDRLRQVVGNLLTNAVKFTRDGRITLDSFRLNNDIVEIQILDTGFGMTEQELSRVFDDFVRTDTAVIRQIQGSGLGLGIARDLVEAMNGEIGAESVEGEGSLFWVRVPLKPEDTGVTPADPAPPLTQAPRSSRILVVEDNATNRFIARRLLENDGHRVSEAVNGAEGVEEAMRSAFDLILMDVSMPVMDGITAAQEIRTRPGPNTRTRIVALTAQVTGGMDHVRTARAMDAVLHKPLDRHQLRQQIAMVHGGQVAMAPAPPPEPPLATLVQSVDPATARRLIDGYLKETDEQIDHLFRNTRGPRPAGPDLVDTIHALAGSAASFGVRGLHQLLIRAELAERAGDTTTASRLVARAARSWPALREEIRVTRDALPVDEPESTDNPG